jgi:putative addiction module component (TIGR02574 family)
MLEAEAIKKMSPTDKLRALELLWDSLSEYADDLPSPPWHEEVLSERLKKVENGSAKFLTIEQLKQHLQGQ